MDLMRMLASLRLDRQPFWRQVRHARKSIMTVGRLNSSRHSSPHQGEREKARRRRRQMARNGGGRTAS